MCAIGKSAGKSVCCMEYQLNYITTRLIMQIIACLIHARNSERIATMSHIFHFQDMPQSTRLWTLDGRLATFRREAWPHGRAPGYAATPETLAQAGFFARPLLGSADNVCCYLCEKNLDGWEPADDAWAEHVRHSPACPLVTLDTEASRVATFAHANVARESLGGAPAWPHAHLPNLAAERMARAGFFFYPRVARGQDDTAVCFQCGLALDGWEPGDDPRSEHVRRRPECPFVRGAVTVRPCSFECFLASRPDVHAVKHVSASAPAADTGAASFAVPRKRPAAQTAEPDGKRASIASRRSTIRPLSTARRSTIRASIAAEKPPSNPSNADLAADQPRMSLRRSTVRTSDARPDPAPAPADDPLRPRTTLSAETSIEALRAFRNALHMLPPGVRADTPVSAVIDAMVARKLASFDARAAELLSTAV